MRLLLLVLSTIFILPACHVTEQQVSGTYRLNADSHTKLVLHKDKTFEFVKHFSSPGPLFFPDSTEMNFRTTGTWSLNKKNIALTSTGNRAVHMLPCEDSVVAGTTITSLSFWNSYGDPVSIRFIKFPPEKIKLYNANSISFFAGDFAPTDTIEFHFYGYQPVKWPSMAARRIADNFSHRITLFEEQRPGYFTDVQFSAERKKLVSNDKSFALFKSN